MQNLTLSLQSRPGWASWRVSFLLLFFFSLLGATAPAFGQAQFYDDAVQLTQKAIRASKSSVGSYTGTGYDTPYNGYPLLQNGTDGNTTNNSIRDLGTYDLTSATQLALSGAALVGAPQTRPTGYTITAARLKYRVYQSSTTPTGFPNPVINLTDAGNYPTGGELYNNFSTNANLLAGLSVGGNYTIDFVFEIDSKSAAGAPRTDVDPGSSFKATFTLVAPAAPTLNPANIQIATDSASNVANYYFPNTGTNPQFPGYNFTSYQNAGGVNGAFDINSGQLRLINTQVTTTEEGTSTVDNVVLYYRTRLVGTGGGAFQPITLTQSGSTVNGSRTFIIDPLSASNTNAQPNLIATPAVIKTGNYIVDVYYQATGADSTTGNTFTIVYPPTGYSSATFSVGGIPIATTIWTGAANDNWFDKRNWSAGVPTKTTNALVRDLGAGNSVPYPNIVSNAVQTTAGGAVLYDNTGSGPAQTLNFTMGGSSQASRSIARLVKGQLQVFGIFDNSYDSFIQRENTIMEFAGVNQVITGGSFVRVDISGGGKKTLGGVMNISESLNFLTPNVYTKSENPLTINPVTATTDNAGVLATDIKRPVSNLVLFSDRALVNYNNGAQINGETDVSYLYGFARTTRQSVMVNETRTYGNLGMTLTFTGTNNPGNVEVTRNTVEAYSPGPNRFGVRRIFGVRPTDQATNSAGLIATMVFHYRDSETKNLNGPSTIIPGSDNIPEQDLTIFVSSNSGNTFQLIGRDGPVDQTNNTVTRTGVTTFATFTLGDINRPLPVVLTAFTATRNGSNALLTWKTATETNSKGFEVQVSTDGTAFRTLGFVSSETPNSVQSKNYKYTDTESGKFGTRYYRLHQVDLDGKDSYSPVRAVGFDGAATGAVALSVYPNPFLDTDKVSLNFGSAVPNGAAQVQLIDMIGRTVRQQTISINNASLELGDLSDLRSGMYLARITLADGSTQSVRLQKK